ncbi:UNVERIFIED_CONTAM: hypothetical protein HDU68_003523 [Siphonaria sp. JEL0065]|nr:hypothetical protein HDU68_003523 [Siphonaria sp. JEL0065]
MSSIADCVSLLKAWPELSNTSGVTASNCCSGVSGVTCTDNRITTMSLNGYSYSTANLGVKTMIGGLQINPGNPIPTALFELTGLTNLWMTGAGLTGPIPSGFSTLQQLNQLHLESNKLTGGFPDDWAQMPNLRYFHADDNLLSILPTTNSIASPNVLLKTCLIQNNRFTGIVPDGWLSGNMAVSWVDLWGNCLSGVGPQVNALLCGVNCNWYDQQANCAGVDTSFQSKCWEVNPACKHEIQFPSGGSVVTGVPPAAASTTATSVSTSMSVASANVTSITVTTKTATSAAVSSFMPLVALAVTGLLFL